MNAGQYQNFFHNIVFSGNTIQTSGMAVHSLLAGGSYNYSWVDCYFQLDTISPSRHVSWAVWVQISSLVWRYTVIDQTYIPLQIKYCSSHASMGWFSIALPKFYSHSSVRFLPALRYTYLEIRPIDLSESIFQLSIPPNVWLFLNRKYPSLSNPIHRFKSDVPSTLQLLICI